MGETEDVGISVLGELNGQRETLLRATHKVQETNSAASRARVALARMSRRACYNKAVLWTIIVLLVVLILLVIYLKFLT